LSSTDRPREPPDAALFVLRPPLPSRAIVQLVLEQPALDVGVVERKTSSRAEADALGKIGVAGEDEAGVAETALLEEIADPRNPLDGRQGVNERIMLRELLRRADMMVIIENKLDALVRLHTPWPPAIIGGPSQHDTPHNLRPESMYGPNAGLTEVLIPAGYVTTVYDPVFALNGDGTKYVSAPSDSPTTIPEPGLPFSLVFRTEPGMEDVLLEVASAYEAASRRRVPPPDFGPL